MKEVEHTVGGVAEALKELSAQLSLSKHESADVQRQLAAALGGMSDLSRCVSQVQNLEGEVARQGEELRRVSSFEKERASMQGALLESRERSGSVASNEAARYACEQLESRLNRVTGEKFDAVRQAMEVLEGKMATAPQLDRCLKDITMVNDKSTEQMHQLESRIYTLESQLSQNTLGDTLSLQKHNADITQLQNRLDSCDKAVIDLREKLAVARASQAEALEEVVRAKKEMENFTRSEFTTLEEKTTSQLKAAQSSLDGKMREECRAAMGILEGNLDENFYKLRREIDADRAKRETRIGDTHEENKTQHAQVRASVVSLEKITSQHWESTKLAINKLAMKVDSGGEIVALLPM